MSHEFPGRMIHVRALNYLRMAHTPTYVGSRILAESLAPEYLDAWTNQYIVRKLKTRRRQVYWKYSLFKCLGNSGEPEYRRCLVGSPTTNLTETWLLSRLSQEAAFRTHPAVYSYHWARPTSSHVFSYFMRGYRRREEDIAAALKTAPKLTVLVLDLKKFYPSIDVGKAATRFNSRIENTDFSASEKAIAHQCVEDLTSVYREEGIPIGPPLSHVLADVYLESIDVTLSEKFRGRYFRYVDDIALVVPQSEATDVLRFVEELLKEEGLRVNSDKLDHVQARVWIDSVESRSFADSDAFGLLVEDIRVYLAHYPERFESLRDQFREVGFNLPFSRLRGTASYSSYRRWRRHLEYHLGAIFGWSVAEPAGLIARAEHLREIYRARVKSLCERPLPTKVMSRRWAIQDFRYAFGRLFYLSNTEEWRELISLVPACEELTATTAVLNALVTGDASEMVKYPGLSVSAFCQFWKESKTDRPRVTWSNVPNDAERDSAAVLALYGLCVPPAAWINHFKLESSQLMVRLSAGWKAIRRSFDNFSYIDEMESFWLTPNLDVPLFLNTRFDDGEDVFLPGLYLEGDTYMT